MRLLATFCLIAALAWPASQAAAETPTAPGGEVDPIGVTGAYDCGRGREPFRIAAFENGLYRIDRTTADGASMGLARFPWQLATATLYRERVTGRSAEKFRRLNGSLRVLHELPAGVRISADYAEAALDGSRQAYEWRYEIQVGRKAAAFAPSGLGEVAVIQIAERRARYVDARRNPLPLTAAASGFEVREEAHIAYAPSLGLALRIERRRDGQAFEACSLSEYRRP